MRFLPLFWSLPLQKHLTFRTNKIIQFLFTHIHHHHPLLREEASTTKRNFLQCSSLPTPSSTLIKSWTREEATHWGNHWSGNSQPPWKPPPGSGSHARQFHSDSQFPTCRWATGLSARERGSRFTPSVSLPSFIYSFKFHLEPPMSWSREHSGEKANKVRALWQLEV